MERRDILDRLTDAAQAETGNIGTLLCDAANEIRHLRSVAGAVTAGESVANIKQHLRTLQSDTANG